MFKLKSGGCLLIALFALGNLHGLKAQEATAELAQILLDVQRACPKRWEDLDTNIHLKPSVIDIWQGDLTDKAQFVQYANEFLIAADGRLLIDNYSDVITIISECGMQRVTYYKTVREQIGAMVGHLVSNLTGQTAFGQNDPADAIDYSNWVDNSQPDDPSLANTPSINLAIGRNTTQSGTSSDELSDTETELTDDEYADLAEGQGYAAKATDNDTDGNFVNGSVTHTGFGDQPFWEVDLDDISHIETITIYNRTDCCTERLSNFRVMVSTQAIDASSLIDALAVDGVTQVGGSSLSIDQMCIPDLAIQPQPCKTIQVNKNARYVRIQLAGLNTVLSLAEVIVMGKVLENNL